METFPPHTLVLSAAEAQMGETLSALRKHASDMSQRAGVETQKMHRLKLALDEIATNIILHAYPDGGGNLTVTTTIDDRFLTVCLEDCGVAFDPTERTSPADLDSPLEDRDIGGLGIFLALNGVDEFRYERVDGCNRNYFCVLRSKEA